MRILLLLSLLLLSIGASAQAVFEIRTPDKIKGFYKFGFGDSTIHYWGNGDTKKKAVEAPLALAKDSLGSDQILSSDLTGKIAVIYRGGGVAFVQKALKSQNAGAVACIIVNNRPLSDPNGQGGVFNIIGYDAPNETATTATGLKVKIPTIVISQEDGALITALIRKGEDVTGYIGGKRLLENDLKLSNAFEVLPMRRTRPQYLAKKGMIHDTLGLALINAGSNLQTNLLAVTNISFGGKSIYADTLFIDTIRESGAQDITGTFPLDTVGYFKFNKVFKPDFDLPVGDYTLTYKVINLASDLKHDTLIDEYFDDNILTSYFTISDSIYAIGNIENLPAANNSNSVNYTNVPVWTTAYRPSQSYTQFSSCIVLKDSNAANVRATSMTFMPYATDQAKPSLKDELVKIQVFEWNPVTTNPNDPAFVGIKSENLNPIIDQEYTLKSTYKWDYITATLESPVDLENGKSYLFCVSTPNPTIAFGFDKESASLSGAATINDEVTIPVSVDGVYSIPGFGNNKIPSLAINVVEVAPKSSAKSLLSFSFAKPAVTGVVGVDNVTLSVPNNTDVTKLVATFKSSPKSTVSINSVNQVSATTSNDFSDTLVYTVTAEDGSTKDYNVIVTVAPKKSAKDITSFSYTPTGATTTYGLIQDTMIYLNVPSGTDLTNMKVVFTSTGDTVKVNNVVQVSNTTANNFTDTVNYVVIAEDGSTKTYHVVVALIKSSLKSVTVFGFSKPVVNGVINGTFITVSVPKGTKIDSLVAKFTISAKASLKVGDSIQASNVTSNNFTDTVTYTVVAEDGSSRDYQVVVIVLKSAAKDITSFGFVETSIAGVISGNTITVDVPKGTDISNLTAKFTTSDLAVVKVGGVVQKSEVTVNDYSANVIYVVTAEDGSTKTYTVVVNELKTNSLTNKDFATISIYPNPSKGLFNVATQKGALEIKVTDLTGKVVYQVSSEYNVNETFKLDLSALQTGSYIASVLNNGLYSVTNIQIAE